VRNYNCLQLLARTCDFFSVHVTWQLVSTIHCILTLSVPCNTTSQGASGGVFGLYAVTVMNKVFPATGISVRSLVEAVVFGYYVSTTFMHELSAVLGAKADNIGHATHIAGILAGAVLVFVVQKAVGGKSSSSSFNQQQQRGAVRDDFVPSSAAAATADFPGSYDRSSRRPPTKAAVPDDRAAPRSKKGW
jgi:Rhomboid family